MRLESFAKSGQSRAPCCRSEETVAAVTQEKPAKSRPKLDARAAMESLNQEAGKFNIWLRTQANSPAQRPWFRDTGMEAAGQLAGGRVGSAQVKAAAHR